MLSFPRGVLAAALVACSATGALAHATLLVTHSPPASEYRATIHIGHGCKGSPTTAVRVTIPDGVYGARPMPKPGWTLTIVKGPYAQGVNAPRYFKEGAREIDWTGGLLPDDEFDEFVFTAFIGDAVAPGGTIYFPVVQECRDAVARWTETPEPGQQAGLKFPAPGVLIVAPAAAKP